MRWDTVLVFGPGRKLAEVGDNVGMTVLVCMPAELLRYNFVSSYVVVWFSDI